MKKSPLIDRLLQLRLPVALAIATTLGSLAAGVAMAQSADTAPARLPAALQADELFWQTFHTGDYAHIQAALEAATSAYLQNPNDAVSAAHVGWLHMWRVAESSRLEQRPASITDDIVLARKYFQKAVALAPDDARYRGFLASAILAEAQIDRDAALRQQGADIMRQAVVDWPAFNLFTAGYVASRLPASSNGFKQALEQQWRNLEVCGQITLDRHGANLDRFAQVVSQATANSHDARACLNSAKAPHNEEGFFLNMGDMLTKSGDWKTAGKVYALARQSPDYAQWPYRDVLEQRIRDAEANVTAFNAVAGPGAKTATPMMIGSNYACLACHQR
jgi:tetratricopeptide (TPR) repeat protein